MLRLQMLGGLKLTSEMAPVEAGPRRRRMAVLALVAAAGPRGISRERVLGVLWPDVPTDQARHNLSQTLYALRRDLNGLEVIDQGSDLSLVPGVVESDLGEFRRAVAARELDRAAEAYGGAFLDGFALPDAPEFERWVEEERRALARQAVDTLEKQAALAGAAGSHQVAARAWRRALDIDPFSHRFASGLLESLAAGGDRAGALAFARQHVDHVRRELDLEPNPEFAAAMERIRAAGARQPATAEATAEAAVTPGVLAAPAEAGHVIRRRSRLIAVMAGAAILAGVLLAVWRGQQRDRPGPPIVAVGVLTDLTAPDSTAVGTVLGEILTTSLGRLSTLDVVATARMLELTSRDRPADRGSRLDAARRAGADEIVEGELSSAGTNSLRLDLRRIDVKTGLMRRGYRVLGADRWAVIDSATVLIAADLALPAPVEALTTRSPIVLRLYEDGLRALYQFDAYAAARTFREVVAQDSTFPMAAYYAWWTAALVGDTTIGRFRQLALRLAATASTHDRLLIRTHVSAFDSDPESLVAADSLAKLFPRDPEALIRAADALRAAAAPVERTAALLDRAIAMDSVAGVGRAGPCRLCEGFVALTEVYAWADSVEAAGRTADRWHRMVPDDPRAFFATARYDRLRGRDADAEKADLAGHQVQHLAVDPVLVQLYRGIERGDPEQIRRGCASAFTAATSEGTWEDYRWNCSLGLRALGQYRAAMALALEGRSPLGPERRGGEPNRRLQAIIDFEAGRPRLAAIYYSQVAARVAQTPGPESVNARDRAWHLTLTATALAGSGDTVRARRLVDSIEALGSKSSYARDQRLHHFIRGLLLTAANQHREAIDHYRLAVNSYPFGYTRINYELAGSLTAAGRATEAIYPLQAALRGGLEGPQLYQSRTELHERLAQAFDLAGQADSAAVHYDVVARCWKEADQQMLPRRDAAREWLRRHGRKVP